MLIKADKIIAIYGKPYFDVLYDDTQQVEYSYKSLLKRSDFTCDMALQLPVNKTELFLEAYKTKNNLLVKKMLYGIDNTSNKRRHRSFHCYINNITLFNVAMYDDDVELLKISNKIHKIPNKFTVIYTDYVTSGYGDVRSVSETSRDHSILDLAKYLGAEKCYTYMKSDLKMPIKIHVYHTKFPIRWKTADTSDQDLSRKYNTSVEGYNLIKQV